MNVQRSQIRLGLSNPKLLARKLSQFYNYRRSQSDYNPEGIDFMTQDWDCLVILDACRYDLFESENTIEGNLRKVVSRGSATPEFLRGNFRDREFLDTVYVTTNPMLQRHDSEINTVFHDVIDLWAGDTWNEEHETVLPETVTREAINTAGEFPNKRILVHYMQPHYPFLGADTDFDKGHIDDSAADELTTWMQVMTGEVDIAHSALWEAYTENLRRALPHVEELVETVTGKAVVTSDHGNMLGERSSPIPIREWGHPQGIWTDELVCVPWLETKWKERREIISEPPDSESAGSESDSVEERLESLGYVDT
jgi:hypothetical protein